jgi:hypothetical protein
VPRAQRSFLACLTALAAACAAVEAITGLRDLTLTLTPLLLIAALLLSGRFLGEERIVARWHGAVHRPAARRQARRRPPRPVPAPRSMLEPGSVAVRGPPALTA